MKKYLICFSLSALLAVSPLTTFAADPTGASEWAKAAIEEAGKKNIIPDALLWGYTRVITRQEFCSIAVKWLESYTGKTAYEILDSKGLDKDFNMFTDTVDNSVITACTLGIANGVSSKKFNPDGQINRESAAVMIRNACKVAGMDVSNTASAGFTDINSASDWARDSINFCANSGIMNGTGAGRFEPNKTYTREQSIVSFNNIGGSGSSASITSAKIHGVSLGDSMSTVEAQWGAAAKVIGGWHIHRDDAYKNFSMVWYKDGKVESIYTMRMDGLDVGALKSYSANKTNVTEYVYNYEFTNDRKSYITRSYAVMYGSGGSVPLDADLLLELENGFRGHYGTKPFVMNDKLVKAAVGHSQDMQANNFFDHDGKGANTPATRVIATSYKVTGALVTENLSTGYGTSLSVLHAWLNSTKGHRLLIISPFTQTGVGIAGTYVTQVVCPDER